MSEMTFDGRVAIITGAGGGLGRSHALALAERGASVLVNDLGGAVDGSGGSKSAAQLVVDEIEGKGGTAVANYESVATPEGGEAIVQAAVDVFGKVDIVINNAGILRDKAFHKMETSMIDAVIDVHLKGAFYVSRPAFILMREQGFGRIVSTTSASGIFGNFGQANYGAAKAGLVGLTRVLAHEGAIHGVKANAIAPIALTRMTEGILGDLSSQVSPETVSPMVVYLASEACEESGNVYSVAGGRIARIVTMETPGVVFESISPESIAARIGDINGRSVSEFVEPGSLDDETVLIATALAGGAREGARGSEGSPSSGSPTSGTSPLLPVFRALRQPPSSRSILPTKSSHRSENSPSRSRSSLPSPRSFATDRSGGIWGTSADHESVLVCMLAIPSRLRYMLTLAFRAPHHKTNITR
jgi:NAD(P)-dependent dehydrogenase (short-subunit alcohol dehydrogenase family)